MFQHECSLSKIRQENQDEKRISKNCNNLSVLSNYQDSWFTRQAFIYIIVVENHNVFFFTKKLYLTTKKYKNLKRIHPRSPTNDYFQSNIIISL